MSDDYDDYTDWTPGMAAQYAQVPAYPYVPAPVPMAGPHMYRTLTATVLPDTDATTAAVSFQYWDKDQGMPRAFTATGSSKRERGDAYDAEVGELLAVSRALAKLAAKLEKRAGSRMRTLASIRDHHAAIKARKRAEQAPGIPLIRLSEFLSSLKITLSDRPMSFGFVAVRRPGQTEFAVVRPDETAAPEFAKGGEVPAPANEDDPPAAESVIAEQQGLDTEAVAGVAPPDKCDCREAGRWGATGRMPSDHRWHSTGNGGGYLAHGEPAGDKPLRAPLPVPAVALPLVRVECDVPDDGPLIVTIDSAGYVRVYDRETGRRVRSYYA